MINLNQRLSIVCSFIRRGTLADIGSDHAYLPIYAIQNDLCTKAIAGEVIQGPYKAAKRNIANYELNQQVDVRLGDGLSVINSEDQIDNITVCGMGGPLIAKILNDGKDKLVNHPRLILQSNIQTQALRQTLNKLSYEIVDERIIEEKGHIYEIVVAEFNNNLVKLNILQEKFGPFLLRECNNIFQKKWQRELEALRDIKSQLNSTSHHERLKEIEDEINLIQEVLINEN